MTDSEGAGRSGWGELRAWVVTFKRWKKLKESVEEEEGIWEVLQRKDIVGLPDS